jgi:hypothetical protein
MSPRVTLCQASLGTINKIAIEYVKTVNALRDIAASPMREMCFFKIIYSDEQWKIKHVYSIKINNHRFQLISAMKVGMYAEDVLNILMKCHRKNS